MMSAVIDIGSGSVGLGLVSLEKGKVPVLKLSLREELRLQNPLKPELLIQQSIEAIKKVIAESQKKHLEPPSSIFCFLSPHLVISQTRRIRLNFGKPTKIDYTLLSKAVDEELERVRKERNLTEVIIERKIMSIQLNGYETSNPNGKTATSAIASVFFTVASQSIIEQIKKAVTAYHNDKIEFHSFSFSYFNILRDLYPNESDLIFIDIGSEIADVSIVRGGILEKSTSFPGGKNTLLRSIIVKSKGNKELAMSMIKNYVADVIIDGSKREFEDDISRAGEAWMSSLEKILRANSLLEPLPEKIFILSDPEVCCIFKKLISSRSLADISILSQEPEVVELISADLSKFYDNRGGGKDDLFLAIPAIFINKLLN